MTANDPEVAAIATICTALGALESDEARQRVMDFAAAKFKLKRSTQDKPPQDEAESGDDSDFFARFEHTKPAENVALLVANHYSKYGTQPFSPADLKRAADAAGLVVPNRIDMTLGGAGRQGKRFYQKMPGNKYRVTVHGEAFLKTTYKVKKGAMRGTTATDSSGA
jgi:hypothetical protein